MAANVPLSARISGRTASLAIVAGIVLGIVVGGFLPEDAHPRVHEALDFLSRGFIGLIKGLVVPLLVSTVIVGIAQAGDARAVGRMGAKALLYFEVVTTVALLVGLVVANVLEPGAGLPIDLGAHGVDRPPPLSGWAVALKALPSNVFKSAVEGEILPVVVFATVFAVALLRIGERGKPVLAFFDGVAQAMFKYTDMVMTLTPLGVFGALGANVSHMAAGQRIAGEYVRGWPAVLHLVGRYALLVGSLYLALLLLFFVAFVPVLVLTRTSPLAYLRAVREPALTAFSTASSEAALPKLMEEVVRFGVPRRVAAFVIPAGYSFNLDGSTLYLVLASLTIAQAAHVDMPVSKQLAMLVTLMLTSKGVAAVPRATLVIIAATCDNFHLPGDAGVAMLLAVDALMDMGRTTINVMGNGLASIVVAKWEGVFGKEAEELAASPRRD